MKIALIAPTALPSRRANAIQTVRMAQAFGRLGHQVLLLAYAPAAWLCPRGERQEKPVPAALSPPDGEAGEPSRPAPLPPADAGEGGWQALAEEYGLESRFEIGWLKTRPWARGYDFALQAIWQAQRWGAGCVFTRLSQAAALGSLLGKPTLFEAHDLPRRGAARLFRLFLLGRGAKRLVAISRALLDDLQRVFPELNRRGAGFVCLAPDGVDLSRYTPLLSPAEARQKLRAWGWELPQGFIAAYTGHLYGGRGAELIVALASRMAEVHFLIVGGEAEQRQALESHFRSLGTSNYTLTGLVAPSQVALFQMASDVLLMPYQQKVAASSGGDIARYLSPLKLFEYLASGRPILASDLPVLMEILTAENAVLLPGQAVDAWERALRRLMQHPQERQKLAEAARHTAEQHSWERRAARILADETEIQAGL